MSDRKGNLLIGHGERLFQDGIWPQSGRPKPDPYNIAEQRSLFTPVLHELATVASTRTKRLAPRGEVAAKLTIHPEFLAKTYFPTNLLKKSGLRLIGSRATQILPRSMVRGKPPESRPSAVLIVAGTAKSFEQTASILNSDKATQDFTHIESITPFLPADRKIGLDLAHFNDWAEVVLHADIGASDIRSAFFQLVQESGGHVNPDRARSVGGLTFLPLHVASENATALVRSIEDFTHLRALRNMPILGEDPFINDAAATRSLALAPPIPKHIPAQDPSIRAVILDGGFTPNLLPWVQAKDAQGVPANADSLPHGLAVTSAFLFGAIRNGQSSLLAPYCNVDHVRVLPTTAKDPHQVADVIDRIISTLQDSRDEGHPYSLANLSLGPRLPIFDDDPHEWTVRLDDYLSLGDLFMTVAAGNDGALGQDLGRIQPPADAVNAFTVGASDGFDGKSKRTAYSCLGPGRSPGLVKPDAVAFGGAQGARLQLVDPASGMLHTHHAGTSYSAPLALRLAAGMMASMQEDIQPTMLHALLVSRAQFNKRSGHDQTEVGWGVLPEGVDDILYSPDDEVVVMYQGLIAKGQPIRATIPLPSGLSPDDDVTVSATFAYRAPIDPAHPVSYTRAGLEVHFQPDGKKSKGFFTMSKYDTEQDLRKDALKWETCRHRKRKIAIGKMTNPCFLIRYHGREEGATDAPTVKDELGHILPAEQQPSALPFALVVRLRVPGIHNLSQLVLQQFAVLSEVQLKLQAQV